MKDDLEKSLSLPVFVIPGQVPGRSTPSGIDSALDMPTKMRAAQMLDPRPVMRVQAVTRDLPLEPDVAANVQRIVRDQLRAPNEAVFRSTVITAMLHDLHLDRALISVLSDRAMSLYRNKGRSPNTPIQAQHATGASPDDFVMDDLEKSEGSRGGHVIGHTASGLPIYERHADPTVLEYAKQHLFKGKSITAAAKATSKALHGAENMMIGPGVSHIDPKMMEHALTGALHAHASPQGEHMANSWMMQSHFKLSDKDMAKIAAHKPEVKKGAFEEGGDYFRKVPNPDSVTGAPRYYYSEDEYMKRPDAHVDGTFAKRTAAKVAVLKHIGAKGSKVADLAKLHPEFTHDEISDAVMAHVKDGKVMHDNDTLTAPEFEVDDASLEKGALPVMQSKEMKKQAAKTRREQLDRAGIKTPQQQAAENIKADADEEPVQKGLDGWLSKSTRAKLPTTSTTPLEKSMNNLTMCKSCGGATKEMRKGSNRAECTKCGALQKAVGADYLGATSDLGSDGKPGDGVDVVESDISGGANGGDTTTTQAAPAASDAELGQKPQGMSKGGGLDAWLSKAFGDAPDEDDADGDEDEEMEAEADEEMEKSYADLVEPWHRSPVLGAMDLIKAAGPFIGPHGGKWADPAHKIPWDEKKHTGKPAPTAKKHDEHMADDLHLTMVNDSRLHGQHEAIRTNLANKMASGKYDHAQATKLFGYMTKRGADQYHKDSGVKVDPATRNAAAKNLADQFAEEAKSGEHDHRLNKKHTKVLAKHKLDNDKGTAYSAGGIGDKSAKTKADKAEGDMHTATANKPMPAGAAKAHAESYGKKDGVGDFSSGKGKAPVDAKGEPMITPLQIGGKAAHASAGAKKASEKAMATTAGAGFSPQEEHDRHVDAQAAHNSAAKAHEAEGNAEMAKKHNTRAREHMQAANVAAGAKRRADDAQKKSKDAHAVSETAWKGAKAQKDDHAGHKEARDWHSLAINEHRTAVDMLSGTGAPMSQIQGHLDAHNNHIAQRNAHNDKAGPHKQTGQASTEKSLSATTGLGDWLAKAQGIKEGDPKDDLMYGEDVNGGNVDGEGKGSDGGAPSTPTSGTGGNPDTGKLDKLSEDDSDFGTFPTGEPGPIEKKGTESNLIKGTRFVDEDAMRARPPALRFQPVTNDRTVRVPVGAPRAAPAPAASAPVGKRFVKSGVIYDTATDERLEKALDGDQFWHMGQGPVVGQQASPLLKSMGCASCGNRVQQYLSVCPHCGGDTMRKSAAPTQVSPFQRVRTTGAGFRPAPVKMVKID